MAYGSALVDNIQSSTAGTPVVFKDGNGTQIGTLCRAWVEFNGSTAAIGASFNVSSVVRNSQGNYTVNFSNAMLDAHYSVVGSALYAGTSTLYESYSLTSSAVSFYITNTSMNVDSLSISLSVFR